jgi:rhodanese-related sulfurtransferase
VVVHRAVLGQDRDAPLAFERVGVHDQVVLTARELLELAVAEVARLLEQLVDERGLAVVDVRDDRDVASGTHVARSGLDYMAELANWYLRTTTGKDFDADTVPDAPQATDVHSRTMPASEAQTTIGFFQIGGGIAGDFPICVVPMIHQDLGARCPYWAYFCQISDSTTSYGSYSGAFPTEKITWGKLDVDTPMFIIESDATIVAPLIFSYVLDR